MFSQQAEIERLETLLSKKIPNSLLVDQADARYAFEDLEGRASLRRIVEKFVYAGFTKKQSKALVLRILVVATLVIALAVVTQRPLLLIFIAAHLYFEDLRISNKAKARAASFEKDYTALLLSLASSIKTGADPLSALVHSVSLFPKDSVIVEELNTFRDLIERGFTEERAIRNFAISINLPDLEMLRDAMILARKEGSSLAICLQRLARVTRQRQSFLRKIKSAIAMQKIASLGIAGCAVAIMLIQFISNPDSVHAALSHPAGSKVIGTGVALILAGMIWMRRIAGREMT